MRSEPDIFHFLFCFRCLFTCRLSTECEHVGVCTYLGFASMNVRVYLRVLLYLCKVHVRVYFRVMLFACKIPHSSLETRRVRTRITRKKNLTPY